jgi:ABC-type branched-subunit amino acid transport system substrate-binding protein
MTLLHTSNLNSNRCTGTAALSFCVNCVLAVLANTQTALAAAGVDSVDAPQVFTSWRTFTKTDGLPSNAIRTIHARGDRIWVGTDDGLAVLQAGKWRSWSMKDGLPAHRIQSIDVDPRCGDVWIGTLGGGLVRFTAGRFDALNQFNSGLAGDLVFAVAVGKGRVWAATNGGISAYDPVANDWELFSERRSDAPFFVATHFTIDGDELYAEFQRIGVRRWDAAARQWLPGESPGENLAYPTDLEWLDAIGIGLRLPTNGPDNPSIIYERDMNQLAGRVSLVRNGRVVEAYVTPETVPDNRIRCVTSHHGAIWVGTANGLALGADPVSWSDTPHAWSRRAPSASPTFLSKTAVTTAEHSSPTPTIGVLGPRSRRISLPGDEQPARRAEMFPDLLAVQIALEFANASGGFRGTQPFHLATAISGYANYGWSLPEDDLIVFADNPNVLGLVAHAPRDLAITDTAIAYMDLPVVSAAPDQESIELDDSRNPWVFRCRGDEPARHRLLLDYLVEKRHCTRLAIITTNSNDSRSPISWWSSYARTLKLPTPLELSWDPAKPEQLDAVVKALRDSDTQAVLTWCDARSASPLLRRIRAAGLDQLYVADPDIMADPFIVDGGAGVGDVMTMIASSSLEQSDGARSKRSAGYLEEPVANGSTRVLSEFTRKYAEQNATGERRAAPDANARRSFDAADHLLAAVNLAGADRDDVRQTLAAMGRNPFGEDHFERIHGPCAATFACLKAGRWVYHTVTSPAPPDQPPGADTSHWPDSKRP